MSCLLYKCDAVDEWRGIGVGVYESDCVEKRVVKIGRLYERDEV